MRTTQAREFGVFKPYSVVNELGKRRYIFDDEFIFALDSWFLGNILEDRSYLNFAKDFVMQKEAEDLEVLDEFLGLLVNALNPAYVSAKKMVNDPTIKATDLITALGDLQRLKEDTQRVVDDGVKRAIKEAKRVAMVVS